MKSKESLVAIFHRYFQKYAGKFDNADPAENGFFEEKQIANEYATSLLTLGDQWKAAVEYDVKQLSLDRLPPHCRKEMREEFRLMSESFLAVISVALQHHGFDIMQLSKETLSLLWIEAYYKGKMIHPKELESIRQQRKAARKPPQASTIATDGSTMQKQPATSTGDTQLQPKQTTIFTDCIANDYRDKQTIIEAELKKVLAEKKGKAAIIVFVACCYHGILRKCPSHQQALFLSESIGKSHKGYNDQKKIYFEESEQGTFNYDKLIQSKLDNIREELLTTEAELKPLFDSLGIFTGDTATHQHER